MPLRLKPDDEAEYQRLCAINEAAKQHCMKIGDAVGAKRMRQANTRLYQEYLIKQLPETVPDWSGIDVNPFERTLEERVARIEMHLGLNKFN